MRWVAMAMLVVGVGLAAASAARNGERLTHFRTDQALVDDLHALQDELQACDDDETLDAAGKEKCRSDALGPRVESGAVGAGQSVEEAIVEAEASRDAVGLPAPTERLTQWANAGALGWLFGVALIVGGAVLARRQQAAEARGADLSTDEQVHFPAYVDSIRKRLEHLSESIADLPMDDDAPEVREEIEDLHADWILPVVDARAQFIAKHGIGAFAEYFGPFSAGERNLERCWSALTDGHAVVARDALERSREAFAMAAGMWDTIETLQGGSAWQPTGPLAEPHHLTEDDVAEPVPKGMRERVTAAGAAALGKGEVPLGEEETSDPETVGDPDTETVTDPETVGDPETVSDEESVSDQVTAQAAPDADEIELDLAEKEQIRALVAEAIEVLESLVDEPFDVDDSDAVVAAVHHALQRLRQGEPLGARWDLDTASRLLGTLWGEHLARAAGWRWVHLVVGSRDGYAVVSYDRAHAVFPAEYVRGLVREGGRDNRIVLIYEMVRDRRVLPAAPGSRTLLT